MVRSEGHSPVSDVATDCKAGVKFDLAGHEATERLRRAESFNSFSSLGIRTTSQFRFNAGLSSYANYSGTHQRSVRLT